MNGARRVLAPLGPEAPRQAGAPAPPLRRHRRLYRLSYIGVLTHRPQTVGHPASNSRLRRSGTGHERKRRRSSQKKSSVLLCNKIRTTWAFKTLTLIFNSHSFSVWFLRHLFQIKSLRNKQTDGQARTAHSKITQFHQVWEDLNLVTLS